MSIKEAKDQAAREYAYDDWEDLIFFNSMTANIEDYINRALELYGDAQWNAAIEKAAEEAAMLFHDGRSKENRETRYYQLGADNLQISKQSILKLKKP